MRVIADKLESVEATNLSVYIMIKYPGNNKISESNYQSFSTRERISSHDSRELIKLLRVRGYKQDGAMRVKPVSKYKGKISVLMYEKFQVCNAENGVMRYLFVREEICHKCEKWRISSGFKWMCKPGFSCLEQFMERLCRSTSQNPRYYLYSGNLSLCHYRGCIRSVSLLESPDRARIFSSLEKELCTGLGTKSICRNKAETSNFLAEFTVSPEAYIQNKQSACSSLI
uniref:Uncharacterized protein n=1 Tax=Strigamia maritima TaxID=126957 RepID=T1JD15_STRMM